MQFSYQEKGTGETIVLTNLSKKSPTSTSGRWVAFLFDFY